LAGSSRTVSVQAKRPNTCLLSGQWHTVFDISNANMEPLHLRTSRLVEFWHMHLWHIQHLSQDTSWPGLNSAKEIKVPSHKCLQEIDNGYRFMLKHWMLALSLLLLRIWHVVKPLS
jgi:hypothetical protein